MSDDSTLSQSVSPSQASTLTPEQAAEARVMELLKQSMMGSGRKRRQPDDSPIDPGTAGTYRWYGRNLVRTCGPFMRISSIVEHGVALEVADSDDESRTAPTMMQKRLTASWDIIKRTIPNFGEDMVLIGGNVQLRRKVCAEIQTGMRGARGDDCGSLKTAVADYLLPAPPPPAPATPDVVALPAPLPKLDPPIPARGSKAHRGMNHPATSAAIRPLKYTDEPATYEAIKAGDKAFPVLGTQLPAFLYKRGQVYNPDDLDAGLLEGHTFRYCAKHIYKGPGSTLEGPGANKGKGGNADINGVTALTDRDMGYVACQARFAMSSVESWSEMDGEFSYVDFYWKVVELLRGEEGEEILDRFNLEVFGTRTTSSRKSGANSVADDEFAILEAQRAEKRARRTAAAGEST